MIISNEHLEKNEMISSIILTGLGLVGNLLLIAYIIAMINRMKKLEEERHTIRKLILDIDDKRKSIKRHYRKGSLSKYSVNLVKDQTLQRRRSSRLSVLKSIENQLMEIMKWNRYVPYLAVFLVCDTLLIIYYCCYILFKRFHVDHVLLTNISNFTCRFLTFSTRLICSASLWICSLMFIDIVFQYLVSVYHKTLSTSNYTLSTNTTTTTTRMSLLVNSHSQTNINENICNESNSKMLKTHQFHQKHHRRSPEEYGTNEEAHPTDNSLKKNRSFNNHRKYVLLFGITVSTLINIYILDRFYLDDRNFCKFNANGSTIENMLKIELYTYKVCGLLLPIILFFLFSLLLLCVRYTVDESEENPLLQAPLFTSIIMCSLMAILYLPYLILSIQTVHSSLKLLRSIELLDLKEDIFILPSINQTHNDTNNMNDFHHQLENDRLISNKSMNTNAAYISYCLNIIRYIFHISKFFVYFFTYPSFRHWLLRSS
ncbi:hypothetical protein SNEBB_009377 [Seison nebaliae]|nr:hypothetical protein SNEBB_009377 [Seison nebaliae]